MTGRDGVSGGPSLAHIRAAVVARLRSRQVEIEEAILTQILNSAPDLTGVEDADYRAKRRDTVTAVVEYGLAGIDVGEDWSRPVPLAAITQAQHAARLGLSLETVLSRYFAGYKLLVEFITCEAKDLASETAVLTHVLSLQMSLLERLISSIAREYTREIGCRGRSFERHHFHLVMRLLDGASTEVSELSYEFDLWHLGLIVKGDVADRALQVLAANRGQRLLSVSSSTELLWVWLGTRSRPTAEEIEDILCPAGWPAKLLVAAGEPARGLDGWRLTHWQAQEALRASLASQRPSRYADVSLLTLVLQNDVATRSLTDIFLTPLGPRHGKGEVVRRTLRAYFKAGGNAAAAANELGVTPKTVRRHVHDIELRIGRSLPTCHAELAVALRLEEVNTDVSALGTLF
jgi:PucR C-terminal helix-turn-helix domain/GGDEF-like domain